ncbi:hypothetical protein [Anaeromyxobacter sp. Fw109-5]|uniref:hypothetical protein n=1 Tax=Anaeromyxobacter sp. (strain Fw109-5) TaxID=404589 RepID=UPI0000ED7E4F|nr:hypothetical protein [Anaeromyxobacter sp. Fw109-5]ABS25598.1 conserved hypothetical protein [Anaeromyxobacter sp. Fw109-5]
MPRAALAVAFALLAACAPRSLPGPISGGSRVLDVAAGGARFRIVHDAADARAARLVADALAEAAPRAQRFGALAVPVTIALHPSHAALERAASRPGYPWLRAWARYATVDLQSPRTWGLLGARRARVAELLAHELAHCAMWQRAGDAQTWMYKGIPRWFTEGLASLAAGQAERHGDLAALAGYYAGVAGGGADPLSESEALYLGRAEVVYGAAHHAVAFLVARYGEARVRAVLDGMAAGRGFPSAFREGVGIEPAAFAAEFRRYVVWRGWER